MCHCVRHSSFVPCMSLSSYFLPFFLLFHVITHCFPKSLTFYFSQTVSKFCFSFIIYPVCFYAFSFCHLLTYFVIISYASLMFLYPLLAHWRNTPDVCLPGDLRVGSKKISSIVRVDSTLLETQQIRSILFPCHWMLQRLSVHVVFKNNF